MDMGLDGERRVSGRRIGGQYTGSVEGSVLCERAGADTLHGCTGRCFISG